MLSAYLLVVSASVHGVAFLGPCSDNLSPEEGVLVKLQMIVLLPSAALQVILLPKSEACLYLESLAGATVLLFEIL